MSAPGRTLQIQTPRAFLPLITKARYKGAFGGRASGKSHFFAEQLVARAIAEPGLKAVCIREVQRDLAHSVKSLVEAKIAAWGAGDYFRNMKTHTEVHGGGVIIYRGMQEHKAEGIKSLEGYDVAWVEEAHMLSGKSLDVLRPTLREHGSELWFSWNPSTPDAPVDNLFRGNGASGRGEQWQTPPDAVLVRASYRDNPWLSGEMLRDLEYDQRTSPEKYAHIWLGEYERHAESRVFRNWTVPMDGFETPPNAVFYFGADWGFSVDPTVLVRAYFDGRRMFIDAEAYAVGCEIDATPALFDGLACWPRCAGPTCRHPQHAMARRWPCRADSARPETISYMQRHGYPRIAGATKGAGSVKEGVSFLQSFEIVVHPRCRHVIDELTMYSWKTDRLTGQILPVLGDAKNHTIDACRYATEPIRRPGVTTRKVLWG